jgi:oxygen-independent coproporphyrinogen-3 oxidase
MLSRRRHCKEMTTRPVNHLYIHVPFCARRCSYCDFSIWVRENTPVASYVESVGLELDRLDTIAWELDTIYLGGGTPSRLGRGVGDLLQLVRERASRIAADAEITLEANPDDVTPESADAWLAAGVNRVSLGGQSFQPNVLAWMHRTHSADQIGEALTTLRRAGFTNVSLDLIFALPHALNRDWSADLSRALDLAPEHISLYGLTIEPHTSLGRWRDRGEVTEAAEETYEADFMLAHDRLSAAGYEHYEVSNFGRPGHRSRHNSSYWSGVPYAAAGPSAHSFDGVHRSWNVAAYSEWERRLRSGETVIAETETLTNENRESERVYLGLRTTDGLRANDAEILLARPWLDAGWAEVRNRTIVLTPAGFLRLDSLAASLTLAGSR